MRNFKEILLSLKEHLVRFFIKIKENKNLLTYLIFLLISTGLWFLNALRKEYTTTVKYPIRYADLPAGYMLQNQPNDWVDIKIKSLGYSLIPYYFGKDHVPLYLSVSNFKLKDGANNETAYVLSSEYFSAVAGRLAKDVELLGIFPDTLSVNLDRKVRKVVPVKWQGNLSFQSEYNQSGDIMIEPAFIEISGPESYIDTCASIQTVFRDYLSLSDSVIQNLELIVQGKVHTKPNKVRVTIPVEAYTEKKLSIPILGINIPDSLKIKTFPANLSLTCRVPVSKFAHIYGDMFKVVVDYNSNTNAGLPDKLKVKVIKTSDAVKNVSYSPLFVECLFERNSEDD